MKKMSQLDMLGWALLVIGGLNWGLVGFFQYNLVDSLLKEGSSASRVVYAAIGLAALWALAQCSSCKKK
tara:strand:- start:2925 stop:3131 length:207 start_codon:yes stop_codon:yes gene_type:complete